MSTTGASGVELTLDDIKDQRAYEREREEFRSYVIDLKKKRRVHVGIFQTLMFENRDTMRFQIQEMARVEKINSDEGILAELRVYNPLISRPGKLSATLFLELTTDEQLREWLPRLAGIERSYELRIGEGDDVEVVGCRVDEGHDETLTRDEPTASVHYIWWPVSSALAKRLAAGPAQVVCTHPNYLEVTELGDVTRESLAADLVDG